MSNENDGGFSGGFIIGGILGLIGGLIFAPRPGEETRAILTEASNEWRDKAKDLTDFARERILDATNEGKRAADIMREEFENEEK
mgnify:CR=1 FL=1|jgi:gas vesicle protein